LLIDQLFVDLDKARPAMAILAKQQRTAAGLTCR